MLMGLGEIRVAPHLREVLGKLRIFHVWIKGRSDLHGLVQAINAQTGFSPPKSTKIRKYPQATVPRLSVFCFGFRRHWTGFRAAVGELLHEHVTHRNQE